MERQKGFNDNHKVFNLTQGWQKIRGTTGELGI
jgi:hypothetical protein